MKSNFIKHLLNIQTLLPKKEYSNASLLSGCSSRLLLYSSIANLDIIQKSDAELYITETITSLIENINSYHSFSYVSGICGFGWTVSYMCKTGYMPSQDENEILYELDEFFFNIIMKSDNFDFFYGILGYANYFLQRYSNQPKIRDTLNTIGMRLVEISRKTNLNSLIWQTNQHKEENCIELGLAHGLSSSIYFFTKLVSLGINGEFYSKLIQQCCRYILSFKTKNNKLPDSIENGTPYFSPLRWCHGEMGMVIALGFAGKILNDDYIFSETKKVALQLSKEKNDKYLDSACICHGTLGVAHIFNKYFNLWGDNIFKDTSEYWYKKSNNIMSSDIGYKHNRGAGYNIEYGVLLGIEGMGLAISSYISNDTNWDSSILLNI